MNNICKIRLHPFSYVFALLIFFTGYFRSYSTFMFIIIIHELGHVLAALLFKWKIEKIVILPFGGLTKFNEKINRPIYEEFIISIMGIIFQIVFCYNLNKYYNILIIIFNLLPIHPLDGSKIINLLFNKIASFKNSYLFTMYISYLIFFFIFLFIIIYRDLILFLIFFPLLLQLNQEYKKKEIVINKFYLERYLYKFNFKKFKIIGNMSKMRRDYKHYFRKNNKIVGEKIFLHDYFSKSQKK